ncbi:MAG TPA: VOC family protein [Edaphobacter sp.]|uniref:VOC family protein n=1 Tax=Edaphobacter sp. TaxID=1934404 RepID=UPI002C8F16FE|nr:VOC family protein [Edaphobacter sp.]HUZ96728.1 VOC family protein [Edaphobacter sp.]
MALTPKRILETCLYVADVDRAAEWYRQIFGFPIIFQQENRLRALQVGQEQVLLLFKEKGSLRPTAMPGGVLPPHDGSGPVHLAFSMQTEEAEEWESHLNTHGVDIIGRVSWGEDDRSLYFRDPDHHVLELISGDHWRKVAAKEGIQR